ncbi:MAG TPA: hypothetical protein VGI76_07330, partial [Solirubrobacteraceae bacterium]
MSNMREHMSDIQGIFARALLAAVLALAVSLVAAAGSARAQFGVTALDQQISSDATGGVFEQAGGHPYAISTTFDLHGVLEAETNTLLPDGDAKDTIVSLPPGLVGNPTAVAQCDAAKLVSVAEARTPECPVASQVGIVELKISTPFASKPFGIALPLFNLVPPVGVPAQFGFNAAGEVIYLTGNVRNGGDFGVDVSSSNIPITLPLLGVDTTFWGVPADPSHDFQRCDVEALSFEVAEFAPLPACPGGRPGYSPSSDPEPPKAFLTMPVSCNPVGEGFKLGLRADSWQDQGVFVERSMTSHMPPGYPLAPGEWGAPAGTTGCELVPFQPSISVEPTNHQADTPTGLNVDISLPQEGLSNPHGLATGDVKDAVVELPAGEAVSPSAAGGLGACSLAQVGLSTGQPAACPDASKLGTVEIDTPLLNDPLKGSIFLGKQSENPFGSLIALYLVVEGHGVILKLPGRVDLDPQTGRIVTTFDNNPQLPFDHLKLNFKAGPRSPLVNPHQCGTYETTAQFTPWSGTAPVNTSSAFAITSGPNGGPCPGSPQAFAPGFSAGTTNNQAGAFSPFALTFTRADGEQQLGGVSLKMPLGLLGRLAGIPLCGEPQAAQGTCDAASQIGSVSADAGAGANPFSVTGGKVFATGPYKGAPYGLSIVVPAVAGPFDLGTVVVRASISVDRHTAQLTITSDPLPTILDGIPLDLRTVHVSVDRPGFIFNPTNCNPMTLTGTLTGGAGSSEPVANGFQVTNCGALGFKPRFTVSTQGHTSRPGGASLDAKIVYPQGAQANIAKVKVSLPKQLPSRLTTLQKACPAATFDADPAQCPVASRVGSATASTPVLPVTLSGPVYFVSNGGEAFPNLVVVLQGYGITVDLVGDTFISKAGITSTTFNTVPDVPIDSFELKLPEGPYSALAANGNLCKARLAMPTKFIAQDGAEINQSTRIAATG